MKVWDRWTPVWSVAVASKLRERRLRFEVGRADTRISFLLGENRELVRRLDDCRLEIDLLAAAADPEEVAGIRAQLAELRALRTIDPGPRSAP